MMSACPIVARRLRPGERRVGPYWRSVTHLDGPQPNQRRGRTLAHLQAAAGGSGCTQRCPPLSFPISRPTALARPHHRAAARLLPPVPPRRPRPPLLGPPSRSRLPPAPFHPPFLLLPFPRRYTRRPRSAAFRAAGASWRRGPSAAAGEPAVAAAADPCRSRWVSPAVSLCSPRRVSPPRLAAVADTRVFCAGGGARAE